MIHLFLKIHFNTIVKQEDKKYDAFHNIFQLDVSALIITMYKTEVHIIWRNTWRKAKYYF